jgi:hypothetical protein
MAAGRGTRCEQERQRRVKLRTLSLAVLVVVTGCSSADRKADPPPSGEAATSIATPTTTTTTNTTTNTTLAVTAKPSASVGDRSALLAAAARARFGAGRSAEGTLTVINHVAPAGRLLAGSSSGPLFTADERAAVATALAPNTVIWADRELIYPAGETVAMNSPNVVLTLGEPVVDGDRAVIESGMGCGGLCGGGGASIFVREADGSWRYDGPTGMQWVA